MSLNITLEQVSKVNTNDTFSSTNTEKQNSLDTTQEWSRVSLRSLSRLLLRDTHTCPYIHSVFVPPRSTDMTFF